MRRGEQEGRGAAELAIVIRVDAAGALLIGQERRDGGGLPVRVRPENVERLIAALGRAVARRAAAAAEV